MAWTAWETQALGRALFPQDGLTPFLAAGAVLFEWHLVWAALSGMETLLFTALSLAAIRVGYSAGRELVPRLTARPAAFAGFLTSLLTATRPEGFLLAGLLGALYFRRRLLPFGLTLASVLLPAALLNLAVGGSPLPSTFFAKNAAYGGGDAIPAFLGGVLMELARGPLLVLFPGLVYGLLRGYRFVVVWILGLLLLYAIWLPAVYHHGRYLIPLVPLLLLHGLGGSRMLLARLPFRVLPRAAVGITIAVLAVSWVRGAQVYRENLTYVNETHVVEAYLLRDNTPPGSIIASHDIGALGFFSERYLVDIAGLATPDLRTSVRDVGRVLDVLRARGVSYVIILPDWYRPLTDALIRSSTYRMTATSPDGFMTFERVR